MLYKTLSMRKEQDVVVLALNRPEKLNALDDTMFSELPVALKEVAADASAHVLMITGVGRGFCAGADLNASILKAGTVEKTRLLKQYAEEIVLALRRMSKPVIGALNGMAIGGGAGIALACDVRIASTDFKLATGFGRLGLVSDFGNAYFLPRLVGTARAFELYWLKDFIAAGEALQWGLVNAVVEPERLEQTAMEWARKIAAGPSFAFGLTKELVYRGAELGLEPALQAEALYQAHCFNTDDFREGLEAVRNKRRPSFKGE